jgi:hypothetical protein
LSSHAANLVDIEIVTLAQPDDSDYLGRQFPKGMHNANLLKLALDLASTNERGNSSIQNFIHGGSSAAWLFRAFKEIYHNGVSVDLNYVPSYNFDLHDSFRQSSPEDLSDLGGTGLIQS